MVPEHSLVPPTKASLKAWWNSFTFAQKAKKESEVAVRKGEPAHTVFGKPLKESLKYANVQISTANANGELYVWGYIPVVVAKCGLYLKENATEIEGTFRVNGSAKRMRDLQAAFETPPRYGKSLDWKMEVYTSHDVASVFRRYLTQMPEPVIPYNMYHSFRDALAKHSYNQDELISTYKRLIRSMPRANQYLLLYVLDLLSVFARKSDKNLMTATNLAVIFRPGIISHPSHEMSPQEHHLSQKVLEFLIAHQDWFMLDIPPPPSSEPTSPTVTLGHAHHSGIAGIGSGHSVGRTTGSAAVASGSGTGAGETEDIMVVPSSDEEYPPHGGWKLVGRESRKPARRRTIGERPGEPKPSRPAHGGVLEEANLSPVAESQTDDQYPTAVQSPTYAAGGALGVKRSRTLPSGRRARDEAPVAEVSNGRGTEVRERERARVLRKQKRASSSQPRVITTGMPDQHGR